MMADFSNEGDLEEALRNAGDVNLIVTGRGDFRSRLAQVELQRLRLWAVHERVSRIGFLTVLPDKLLALFAIGDQPPLICSGVSLEKGEILICGPSHRLHMRTEGPGCWGAVSLPAGEFTAYFNRLTGKLPRISRQPRPPTSDEGRLCKRSWRPWSKMPPRGRDDRLPGSRSTYCVALEPR
jgi:hypothetical protein